MCHSCLLVYIHCGRYLVSLSILCFFVCFLYDVHLILLMFFFSFFFFKQKTAYEMRISDWSSDVCSSDLRHVQQVAVEGVVLLYLLQVGEQHEIGRASCRERVCHTCRSRWSPYH